MEHEPSGLFAVAPSHVYVVAHYDWRAGWTLSVSSPAVGNSAPTRSFYEGLSSTELVDVAGSELARVLLGSADRY